MRYSFWHTLLCILVACVVYTAVSRVKADTLVTPYISLGTYYRDCNLTSNVLCENDFIGSDWPGTVDIGFRLQPDQPVLWLLYADEVDVGWHHQSYVDRGILIPALLEFGGEETHVDMFGAKFTWLIKSYSFKLSF